MKVKNNGGIDMIKCNNKDKFGKPCEYYNVLYLKFRFGTELYNSKLSNYSTSRYFKIPLLSPTSLKVNLLKIVKYYKELDEEISIDNFKKYHQSEFWNSIWYFGLHGIDISFILPYNQKEKYYVDRVRCVTDSFVELNKINIKETDNDEEIIIEKKNYLNNKYGKGDLCIQIVHQFAFINFLGMVSYKNIYLYEENINYNELPLIFYDSELEQKNLSLRESTLTRCITTRDINESISEIGSFSDIGYLIQSDKKGSQTLMNSSSSPMLINNQNNQKKY